MLENMIRRQHMTRTYEKAFMLVKQEMLCKWVDWILETVKGLEGMNHSV